MDDHVMVHGTTVATLASTAVSTVNTTYIFSMGNANLSTGQFDQYRIQAIRFSIVPQNNAIGLVTNTTTTLVPLYCVIDYDDATALTTAAQAEAYNNCITLAPGESLVRTFQPRMAVGAYTGTFSGYANMAPQWIDAVSPLVQHYGIKTFIPGAAASQTLLQTWQVIVEYAVELRANIN
jgi:hypothetical protein